MKIKFDALFWALVFVITTGCAVWQTYQLRRLQSAQPVQSESVETFRDTVKNIRAYELAQVGKTLVWPVNMEVFGPSEPVVDSDNYRLILAIDDLSCDVCRDEETQFVLDLAHNQGVDVSIVVRAAQKRYVRSYMRLNAVDLPVFHDVDGQFFARNDLGDGPLLMLTNLRGEVVAAHWPLPGDAELCEPFHRMCTNFFQGGP